MLKASVKPKMGSGGPRGTLAKVDAAALSPCWFRRRMGRTRRLLVARNMMDGKDPCGVWWMINVIVNVWIL